MRDWLQGIGETIARIAAAVAAYVRSTRVVQRIKWVGGKLVTVSETVTEFAAERVLPVAGATAALPFRLIGSVLGGVGQVLGGPRPSVPLPPAAVPLADPAASAADHAAAEGQRADEQIRAVDIAALVRRAARRLAKGDEAPELDTVGQIAPPIVDWLRSMDSEQLAELGRTPLNGVKRHLTGEARLPGYRFVEEAPSPAPAASEFAMRVSDHRRRRDEVPVIGPTAA